MYKISIGLSPILIQKLFMANNEHTYSLRHLRQFKTSSVKIAYHGTERVSLLGRNLPDSFKKVDNIDTYKKAIKTWKPSQCFCRLYKVYALNTGFL